MNKIKVLGKKMGLMIVLVFCTILGMGQENDFTARLKTQLLLFRTRKVDQVIVIQTDKSLYRQGETIWMKGYVTDAVTQALSLNSLELSVQLIDNKGGNVLEGKFMLKNGVADFNFAIPADLPSDVYYLVAYTPEMENGDFRNVFKKGINIGRPEILDIVPHLEFSKPFYLADCKESASLRLTDMAGKPVTGKKFEYQIFYQNRELLSGKGKTGPSGSGDFVFFTPPVQNGAPLLVSLTISAGRDHLNIISKIPTVSERVNVLFFPEGGKRVPGIAQLVVFEAKDQLGNPVKLNSEIVDEQGKVIVLAATTANGMGSFSLLNCESAKLTMKILSDPGRNQEFQLPPLSQEGMILRVKGNDGKNLALLMGRAPKSSPSKFKIVAVANGVLVWAGDFELEQSGVVNVPLDNFRSGIAAFAVFNEKGTLVGQRLIMTGKSQSLNVAFSSKKNAFKPGEEDELNLKITDQFGHAVRAELAVSIADKYSFPSSAYGVENLLYGLKRAVPVDESEDKSTMLSLDDFLLSESLTGFDWDQVMSVDPAKGSAGKVNAIRISGNVSDDKNLPVANALVSLSGPSLKLFNTTSDQQGAFSVNLPVSVDKQNLSATATDGLGKVNYRVKLNKSFKDELVNSLKNITAADWGILGQMSGANYFKENADFFKAKPSLKIRGSEKKITQDYWKRYVNGSSNILEILSSIRPYEMSGGKIIFRGRNSFMAQDGALIVVDGVRMGTEASQLSGINPLDIEDIRILLDPVEMGQYSGLNSVGVIEITTKRGTNIELSQNEILRQSNEKSPKIYSPEPIGEMKYDLKTTLQWMPVLFTNDNGEATIPFKTGNIKSTFVVEIAGFSNQHQWIGRQTEIKVE